MLITPEVIAHTIDLRQREAIARIQRIHVDAVRIIRGITEAINDDDTFTALSTWHQLTEHIDLRCWAFGFERARSIPWDDDDIAAEWRESVAIARGEWEASARRLEAA